MAILKNAVKSVSLESLLIISEQLKRCICRIKFNETEATGFFCLIPYNNKYIPVLITANHVVHITDKSNDILIKINGSEKIIKSNDNRKIFSNKELDVTIIEIIPKEDHIYDFLRLDENIFQKDSNVLEGDSIYILHHNFEEKIISYGIIKAREKNKLHHFCNTESFSGGAPILNISNGRIIGIHIGTKMYSNYNIGTNLKDPINQYIDQNKDYIRTKGLDAKNFSFKNEIYTLNELDGINLNINGNNSQDKIKELEEKIKELNDLLNDRINKANSIISKNNKDIDVLKEKLSRFPFELLEGEKLMSIIIESSDKSIQRSIICKSTDVFCDLQKKIFKDYDKCFDIRNYFTLYGEKIDETKTLEKNNIKDNDIIVLNNIKI